MCFTIEHFVSGQTLTKNVLYSLSFSLSLENNEEVDDASGRDEQELI